jgi:hypothetical protein
VLEKTRVFLCKSGKDIGLCYLTDETDEFLEVLEVQDLALFELENFSYFIVDFLIPERKIRVKGV